MTLDLGKTDEKLLATVQQEYKILAEYQMVESERTGGIYVIPSYENSLLWFGVIFPRVGLYKDAVFRFNISLPDKFPEDKNPPAVLFQSEIYHPLICPYTGSLDLSQAFPHWKTGEDHIWQLLKYILNIFIDPWDCLKQNGGNGGSGNGGGVNKFLNQDAADLMRQNRNGFISKLKECITLSIERIYDPPTTEDPHYISFEQFNDELHGPVLENMKKNINLSRTTPPNSGLSWVKEGEFKPLSKEG